MSTLREIVRAALDKSVDQDGQAQFLTHRPETVAIDLALHRVTLRGFRGWVYIHELVPHVKEWQADRAAQAVTS